MQQVKRNYVQEQIESGARISIIEVLDAEYYNEGHLPHAINIPIDDEFETSASLAVPNKDEPVIVYCRNESCEASTKAAERLEAMGYDNVMDYAGGKKDWLEAGLALTPSSERASAR
jgi:rhodanese-related sulfurtransferase